MAQLSHVIEIRREPKQVFELLGDPTRDAEWAGPVVAVEALMPGPIGVGSRLRQTSRTLGVRFPMLLEVTEYAPLAIKSAVVGYGRAEKSQVQQMVMRLLNLPALPEPPDVADALAIAICDLHTSATLHRQRTSGHGTV